MTFHGMTVTLPDGTTITPGPGVEVLVEEGIGWTGDRPTNDSYTIEVRLKTAPVGAA
jgi:hypothetical protein